ncbi:hypothetical protein [Timonella sp. A28]|uniref:hypothetical protein n=1 Tax=Timonella sp. A28 TaxID=3442640 RepID=UPI003EBA556C
MSEYVPDTDEVRDDYATCGLLCNAATRRAGFDRWLAEEKRKAKVEALKEAADDPEIKDNRIWVEYWLLERAQQLKEQ